MPCGAADCLTRQDGHARVLESTHDEPTRVDARSYACQDSAARARERTRPMAGLLTPAEAWALLRSAAGSRSSTRVRAPSATSSATCRAACRSSGTTTPQKVRNPKFLDELRAKVDPATPVAFLCRSGVRSHHAAALATANGYRAAYNIIEGFEGDKNAQGQRRVNGWQVAGGCLAAGLRIQGRRFRARASSSRVRALRDQVVLFVGNADPAASCDRRRRATPAPCVPPRPGPRHAELLRHLAQAAPGRKSATARQRVIGMFWPVPIHDWTWPP